jgi:TRAP-type mannitol/chloroaromatic compound transport system substrate-binding protein
MDADMVLAWHRYGGGKERLAKVYASIGANVVSFLYGPMPTQPLGWFRKPVTKLDDFKALKFRTVGLAVDLYASLGATVSPLPAGEIVPALERGTIEAAEFNNVTSDRTLGLPNASYVCMLQSFHQNAEQFEILVNKTAYDALPEKMRAVVAAAADASSADMAWKAIDRYSKDYAEMRTEAKVRFYKTPDTVLQAQLVAFDAVATRKASDNALFRDIETSQRAFAVRAVRWDLDTRANRRMAYNHYFGPRKARPKS